MLSRSGVEEAIRCASPVFHTMRYATHPVMLRNTPVSAGEAVVAWIASANRDENVFPRPDSFDLTRQPNRHIAFGGGPHYCIGAVTARIMLRIAFEEILDMIECFEPTGPASRLHSTFINGIKHLQVITRPRPGIG